MVVSVSASTFTCYNDATPIRFEDNICLNKETSYYACQGGGYACRVGFDYDNNWDIYEFYCDGNNADDFVICEEGCNKVTGLCNEGPRDCSEGYMQCGIGTLHDRFGDVYKCLNGKWQLAEACGDKECLNPTYNNAYCYFKWYYCQRPTDCFKSSTKQDGCFDTLEKCLSAIPIYCVKGDDKTGTCTKRYNECLPGELARQGTHIDDKWCNGYGFTGYCKSCFSWLWNTFKDESEQCITDVVWEAEGWKNPLSWLGVEITQDEWCPIFLIAIGCIILIALTIIFVVIIAMRRKGKNKK